MTTTVKLEEIPESSSNISHSVRNTLPGRGAYTRDTGAGRGRRIPFGVFVGFSIGLICILTVVFIASLIAAPAETTNTTYVVATGGAFDEITYIFPIAIVGTGILVLVIGAFSIG